MNSFMLDFFISIGIKSRILRILYVVFPFVNITKHISKYEYNKKITALQKTNVFGMCNFHFDYTIRIFFNKLVFQKARILKET